MDISAMMQNNLRSLQSAIGMSTLKRAMNTDAQTVSVLINDMQQSMAKITPPVTKGHGDLIDVRA